MDFVEKAKQVFDQHDDIMRTKDLSDNGIHYKMLQQLIDKDLVEKIRYGYYQWQDDRAFSEAATIVRLFPDGILCMDTALQYYGYTVRTPAAWCIAVDRNSTKSRFSIDFPIVKPYYIPSSTLHLGEESGKIDGTPVKIYSRDRVICDCLKHENKMDAEIFNKAIQSYVKDPYKKIPQLMTFAKALKVERKVRTTIGVWL